jgi:hypothetical protein
MAQRSITEAEVEQLLAGSHTTSPGKDVLGRAPRIVYRGIVLGRPLKVVVEETDPPTVVTVARPDK